MNSDAVNYWSVHSSLYGSIDSRIIESLEEAVEARFSGHLDASLRIFEERLSLDNSVPVITLEKVSLLQWMGQERQSVELCEKVLEELEHSGITESSLWHLLSMTIGLTEVFSLGKLSNALGRARQFRKFLLHIPVGSYKSIEVRQEGSKTLDRSMAYRMLSGQLFLPLLPNTILLQRIVKLCPR